MTLVSITNQQPTITNPSGTLDKPSFRACISRWYPGIAVSIEHKMCPYSDWEAQKIYSTIWSGC